MTKEKLLEKIIPENVDITPMGIVSLELENEKLESMMSLFFDDILKIKEANVSSLNGFGEFDEKGLLPYNSFEEMIKETFSNDNKGYWLNWKELYETSCLDKEFFEKYYQKLLDLSKYCTNQRFLVNNNTFFDFMIVDGSSVGFPDWTRAGVTDFLLDITLMDLEKPYLLVPEKFYDYITKNKIEVKNYKERFLCMAYFKGLDTLRWHASIDDEVSVKSIMESMSELEQRLMKLGD